MRSAYRQVALSSKGRRSACIRVFDLHSKCMRYFRSRVLLFGAVRSAHAFLRLSRAIWWIGVAGCGLLWTSFYDDFISFSRPALARCTENTIVSLFKMLGWSFAEEGDKCLPFDKVCDALGVSFDLRGSCDGLAAERNTDTRVQELCNHLQEIVDAGTLGAKQAQRLRGRIKSRKPSCLEGLEGGVSKSLVASLKAKNSFWIPRILCFLNFSKNFAEQCAQRSARFG